MIHGTGQSTFIHNTESPVESYCILPILLCYPAFFFHQFQCSSLLYTIHKFWICLLYNSCISMQCNVFTFEHPIAAFAGSILNERFIPIPISYRVLVLVERGRLIRSSNNSLTSLSRRYSKYCHDKATENPMYQTYT